MLSPLPFIKLGAGPPLYNWFIEPEEAFGFSFLILTLPGLEIDSPPRWLSAILSPDPLLLPLVDFGGCGKLAMLTDRLSGLSVDESSFLSCGVLFDTDRRVGMFGLEALWLMLKIEFGLLMLEGVRNALFDDDEEGNREMVGELDEDVGCRILDMGNWGRADVGGGAGS